MTTTSPSPSVYTGRTTNWPMIWLTTALLLPLVALAPGSDGSWTELDLLGPLALALAAATANLLTATSVRSTAGPQGVTVHFGVLGWPRFRYPITRIRHAEATTLPQTQWAWGLYWTPRRGLMLTLRPGPALRLTLTNGRHVTISTPDPAAALHTLDLTPT